MSSLKTILESKNIIIPLRNYGIQDLSTGWEVKAIVENRDVFEDLYSQFPLREELPKRGREEVSNGSGTRRQTFE